MTTASRLNDGEAQAGALAGKVVGRLSVGQFSIGGRGRRASQGRVCSAEPVHPATLAEKGTLLVVVSDEPKRTARGETVEAITRRVVDAYYRDPEPSVPDGLVRALRSAVTNSDDRVDARGAENSSRPILVAAVVGARLHVVGIGPTRWFLIRCPVEGAAIAPNPAPAVLAHRGASAPDPTVQTVDLQPDDRIVLASPGLGALDVEEVAAIAVRRDPRPAADALVRRALRRGATDAVGVIVARFDAPPDKPLPRLPRPTESAPAFPALHQRSVISLFGIAVALLLLLGTFWSLTLEATAGAASDRHPPTDTPIVVYVHDRPPPAGLPGTIGLGLALTPGRIDQVRAVSGTAITPGAEGAAPSEPGQPNETTSSTSVRAPSATPTSASTPTPMATGSVGVAASPLTTASVVVVSEPSATASSESVSGGSATPATTPSPSPAPPAASPTRRPTPRPTRRPSPTPIPPTPSATTVPPSPTASPTPSPIPTATPIPDQSPVLNPPVLQSGAILLSWSYPGALAADEFFDVRVWSNGQPPLGIANVKDTSYLVGGSFPAGDYDWTIAVVRHLSDGRIETVSIASTISTFTWAGTSRGGGNGCDRALNPSCG